MAAKSNDYNDEIEFINGEQIKTGRKIAVCGTTCGSKETYEEQVPMPLNGRVRSIDRCIAHIVAALNAANVRTVACCCGHGKMDGNIMLEDGRILIIKPKEFDVNSMTKYTPNKKRKR